MNRLTKSIVSPEVAGQVRQITGDESLSAGRRLRHGGSNLLGIRTSVLVKGMLGA
jgi:hypothetical protein